MTERNSSAVSPTPRPLQLDAIRALVLESRLLLIVGAGAALIAATLALGLISRFVLPFGTFGYHLLDMDGERSIPAIVSGGLLLTAGALALTVAPARAIYRLLGAGLVYAALDEVFAVHEHLQRLTDVNWIKLYLPVFAACAVVAVLLVRELRSSAPRAIPFLVVGSGCWMLAQIFEWFEWFGTDVAQPGYIPMMFAEEVLEDVGSLCFVVAVVLIARATATEGARVPGNADE